MCTFLWFITHEFQCPVVLILGSIVSSYTCCEYCRNEYFTILNKYNSDYCPCVGAEVDRNLFNFLCSVNEFFLWLGQQSYDPNFYTINKRILSPLEIGNPKTMFIYNTGWQCWLISIPDNIVIKMYQVEGLWVHTFMVYDGSRTAVCQCSRLKLFCPFLLFSLNKTVSFGHKNGW